VPSGCSRGAVRYTVAIQGHQQARLLQRLYCGEVQNATEIDPEYRSEDPRPERTLAERLVLVLIAADRTGRSARVSP
jgi:hypothetical protein